MLEQVLRRMNNWFLVDIYEGEFRVENGSITLPFLLPGQYFRVIGSIFNDGLHQYYMGDLVDETFTGVVWALAVPNDVVSLANEISEWQEKHGEAAASPFVSESFGGYSYTKKTGNSESGAATGWQEAFASRLREWRKL